MARLSVVIPGYNTCEKWWRACIASVQNVISTEDEIICVDDRSERKPEFLNDLAAVDPRIKVIFRETNGGLALARNTALEVAQGKYVTFLDSDDVVCGSAYDRCVRSLEMTKSDIAIYGIRTVWVDVSLSRVSLPDEKVWGKLLPTDVKFLTEQQLLNYSCNKVYRLSFLNGDNLSQKSLRFNHEGMPCEDIIFNLDCLMAEASWCGVREEGYIYYRRDGTLLSNYKKTCSLGLRAGSEAWRCYKGSTPGARDVLGNLGEYREVDYIRREWVNQWRPCSPVSLMGRWRFLREHYSVFSSPLKVFVRQLFYSFLRRYFYIRPIRRAHIRKIYPDVTPWT